MHFLYIDEAGSTGADLHAPQQPVFVMSSLVVSDEKWSKTTRAVLEVITKYLGKDPGRDFELHACELLAPDGEGPFAGHPREARNQLALDLLSVISERGHCIFHVPIYKSKLAVLETPSKEWGFDWKYPWQMGFHLQMTMFEEFLRSSATGSTSTGLAIVDHEDKCVDFVRRHTAYRHGQKGWQQLKKVVEIGYSASSHANPLIQMADLTAFTLKKYYETRIEFSSKWPQEAKEFFEKCKSVVWPRIKFKNPSFTKLNVHESLLSYAKLARKP